MAKQFILSEHSVTFRQIAAGDKDAFELLFRQFYAELCRFSLKYVRDKEAAEEVVQNLFVTLWEQREQVEVQTSLKSYLFTATRNRSLNYLKSRFAKAGLSDETAALEIEASHSNPETQLQQQELEQVLNNAIESLPEKCRIIFQLSRQGGLTYPEIARELNLSPKTVENQMGFALKKLRTYLQLHWDKALPVWLLCWLKL